MIVQQNRWQDLAPVTKLRIVTMGALQFALLGAALWDLSHRTAEEVKGSKKMWVALSFVNFFGPLTYFFFGRKPRAPMPQEEPIGYG